MEERRVHRRSSSILTCLVLLVDRLLDRRHRLVEAGTSLVTDGARTKGVRFLGLTRLLRRI